MGAVKTGDCGIIRVVPRPVTLPVTRIGSCEPVGTSPSRTAPENTFSRVDLPQPEGPMMPMTVPRSEPGSAA